VPLRINEEVFRYWLRRLTRKQKLYRILKEELTAQGYWKNRKRGKPGRPNR
jgi:hypothetical protein